MENEDDRTSPWMYSVKLSYTHGMRLQCDSDIGQLCGSSPGCVVPSVTKGMNVLSHTQETTTGPVNQTHSVLTGVSISSQKNLRWHIVKTRDKERTTDKERTVIGTRIRMGSKQKLKQHTEFTL